MLVCLLDFQFQHVYNTIWIFMILNNSKYDIEPNQDLVLRDEKVFPELRNRSLLPRDFSAIQPYEFLS